MSTAIDKKYISAMSVTGTVRHFQITLKCSLLFCTAFSSLFIPLEFVLAQQGLTQERRAIWKLSKTTKNCDAICKTA